MLRIRDDVDLKELERFGFTINKDCANYQNANDEYIFIYPDKKIEIEFERFYDELDIGGPSLCHSLSNTLLDSIYDLIQAELIEKV